MNNLEIYELGRSVPQEAIKPISAGRLKGMSDINPMWRIKKLTEIFGPCGIGWWYDIVNERLETGKENEVRAFVDINLFYRWNDEISRAVPGTGGSSFVTVEKGGPYVSDECFKMALTDAISVAAKNLGIGADIYFDKDRSKYTAPAEKEPKEKWQRPVEGKVEMPEPPKYVCEECGSVILPIKGKDGEIIPPAVTAEKTKAKYGKALCLQCARNAAQTE